MSKVLIIGGGAAGMLASIAAAKNGHQVHLYEKNQKLGKKLFITGKGRCNITNACDMETLFDNVISNPKFLYSAFYSFNNYDMMDLLNEIGLKTKIERGGRVFPESDKSSDVIRVLQNEMTRLGVQIHLGKDVQQVLTQNNSFLGIELKNGEKIEGDGLIIATGGMSYSTTGSTGDGYKMAKKMGHNVTDLAQGLVPFNVKEQWIKELQGLSLKNIRITICQGKKELYTEFGEMLFTHFGVSGPVIISASSHVTKEIEKQPLTLKIDLKASLTEEQLDARLLRGFDLSKNKQFKNSLDSLLPKKMIPVMLNYIGIAPEKQINTISKEERKLIVNGMKDFKLTLLGLRGFREAIITRGGVSVKDINPSTMESKQISNVHFAGEVMDIDALTGGFNLQIAWSTAYAAGNHVL
ncbi:MAG: NAD(P)/FAD-dependent oxidoreductase [Clostridiales bacterium]|nr:NAD(P)/FAD-dependent oxidoreductase [Clostridiales bacterium]